MNFDFDWAEFVGELNPPKDNSLEFSKVAHAFRKVAFDAYEKIGEAGLWELREREDGTKILVALYDEGESLSKKASASPWTAGATKSGDSVTLQFKGTPVAKFASKEFGFQPSEAESFSTFLAKSANDKEFVNKLANTLSPNQRAFLLDLISKSE